MASDSAGVPRVLLHVDMDAFYAAVEIRENPDLGGFADHLPPTGIEEGYLDVTARCGGDYERARALAADVKAALRKEQRLTCSIGIAPTKAVAKIASDFEKPDGLTVVMPDHVVEFLTPFSVRKILGVGPKTADRFKEIGLETIGDVQQYSRQDLVE